MSRFRMVKGLLAAASCLGLLLPPAAVEGAGPSAAQRGGPPVSIDDVALDAGGGLQGVVVDIQGAPRPDVEVVLVQQDQQRGTARTDRLGRFRIAGQKGGVYLLRAGGQGRLVRAWTTQAAPPAAKPLALLVVGDDVVRGQMPLEDFFASDALVITGLVAAMIAIPIAVHNQGGGGKEPASP